MATQPRPLGSPLAAIIKHSRQVPIYQSPPKTCIVLSLPINIVHKTVDSISNAVSLQKLQLRYINWDLCF